MGVNVDETRGDREAGDIDPLAGLGIAQIPDRGDLAIRDRDVGDDGGCARAVDDAAVEQERFDHRHCLGSRSLIGAARTPDPAGR